MDVKRIPTFPCALSPLYCSVPRSLLRTLCFKNKYQSFFSPIHERVLPYARRVQKKTLLLACSVNMAMACDAYNSLLHLALHRHCAVPARRHDGLVCPVREVL